MTVFRFSLAQRAEIAKILRVADNASEQEKWIGLLEKWRGRAAADEKQAIARWNARVKELRLKRPRGRPESWRLTISELHGVAIVYYRCTKAPIRNSRSHPFYSLSQLCLGQTDPTKLIQEFIAKGWAAKARSGDFFTVEQKAAWRRRAEQVDAQAAAWGLRPDD